MNRKSFIEKLLIIPATAILGTSIIKSKKKSKRSFMTSYELEVDKIKTVDSGVLYVSEMGIWLPVDDYIKLVQSGQIKYER
jgi:hypothetical protein